MLWHHGWAGILPKRWLTILLIAMPIFGFTLRTVVLIVDQVVSGNNDSWHRPSVCWRAVCPASMPFSCRVITGDTTG